MAETHAEDILPDISDRDQDTVASKPKPPANTSEHDVVIVGGSLAGCATAILLGRAGARVALLEKSPDADAFKRICSHYIQSSAIGTLERLGLLEPMMQAGAVRSRVRLWTRAGWVEPPRVSIVPSGVNLRRSRLDPLIRELAASTAGVELMLGYSAQELLREDGRVCGVQAHGQDGETIQLHARLVVGADGRGSRMAKLAGVTRKTAPHGRIAYGGYYEGPQPQGAPASTLWIMDPDMVAAFPTDSGYTFYAAMPTKDRLPEFRSDPQAALERFVAGVPDAPPIAKSRLLQPVQGKVDMTNVLHRPIADGFALVGDAAGALDPLWGVGCGFALQSAEWLADSVAPALSGAEPLEDGLKRYRRHHARGLGGHTRTILDYATGRKMNMGERMLFSAASYDERTGRVFEAFGSRNIGPVRMLAQGVPLAMLATARRSISRRSRSRSGTTAVAA
ncbi:MAG TPA: NAD(P)/FAD-dependent oxidoreductase [Solirubrobacteraceae bacterium]|jgi:flavin-dependent dehydrogenase